MFQIELSLTDKIHIREQGAVDALHSGLFMCQAPINCRLQSITVVFIIYSVPIPEYIRIPI